MSGASWHRSDWSDLELPNLDCQSSPEELLEISAALKIAMQYANAKAAAMMARLRGDVQDALDIEHRCELLYQSLPESLRW